ARSFPGPVARKVMQGPTMNTSVQPALGRPAREANGVEVGKTPKAASMSKIEVSSLNFYYGAKQALYAISLKIPEKKVTALIGPSGCGKSTFLRTLNRMQETVRRTRVEGEVLLDGQDIFRSEEHTSELQSRFDLVCRLLL